MEAPGLGSMLLDDDTLPEFGFVDALVENGLGGLDERFLTDMRGPSALADRHGRIDVVPAFGKRSRANPSAVLSKLARAYAEDVRADGKVATILDQVREIIDQIAQESRYDAVLIDARAGLHETSASAILGLGADVFLFGLDEPQTFEGYAFLLAHIGTLACRPGVTLSDWMDRTTMVQGRASADRSARVAFAERCAALIQRSGLTPQPPAAREVPLPAEPFNAVPWEDSGGLEDDEALLGERVPFGEPVAILEDPRFRNFDPIRHRELLAEESYRPAYEEFLARVSAPFVAEAED
jgi:hypothetical protein